MGTQAQECAVQSEHRWSPPLSLPATHQAPRPLLEVDTGLQLHPAKQAGRQE